MTNLVWAIERVIRAQSDAEKPLGIVLAGHNGSGKSTMWRKHLSPHLQMPLINADRMMLSVLPEPENAILPDWAVAIRDTDESWMHVAQKGVESFGAHAMSRGVPFAIETVFSFWRENKDGTVTSKIDLIRQMQNAGYFVLLCFVGLPSFELSVARVATRVAAGGHAVALDKLEARFSRTQKAIRRAASVADAAVLVDNSFGEDQAFSVCRVQLTSEEVFDVRDEGNVSPSVREWMDVVSPRGERRESPL
jgi:predicted ABC-type ATPase